MEEGETDIDAAMREAEEECGKVAGKRFADLNEKDGMHVWTTFFFRVDKPFKCKLSDEHSDWKWVKLESLKDYDLHPKLKENLERHLKAVRRSADKGVIKFGEWLKFKSDNCWSE